jgi:protoheme IX farnesyltransferase
MVQLFLVLTKPSILKHALITFFVGYFLAAYPVQFDFFYLLLVSSGFLGIAGAAGVLNHVLEYRYDALMPRTKMRPIVTGAISVGAAVFFACGLAAIGTCVLVVVSAYYTLLWSWIMLFLYNFVYTPLKRITWLNTYIGSFPGALPPVCGWVAVGEFSVSLLVLFGIFFIWQVPHFFALNWKYRQEYQDAGFKMLSSYDLTGKRIGRHMVVSTLALMGVVGCLKVVMPLTWLYGSGAIILSFFFFYHVVSFSRFPTELNARSVFLASILYQPVLVFLILLDRLVMG